MRCIQPDCSRWGHDSLGGLCGKHAPQCEHGTPEGWWCLGCEADNAGMTEHDAFRADHRGDRDWLARRIDRMKDHE